MRSTRRIEIRIVKNVLIGIWWHDSTIGISIPFLEVEYNFGKDVESGVWWPWS